MMDKIYSQSGQQTIPQMTHIFKITIKQEDKLCDKDMINNYRRLQSSFKAMGQISQNRKGDPTRLPYNILKSKGSYGARPMFIRWSRITLLLLR